eukprot:scaffold2908_cov257-Pinguiococcus_pyrenoidosus.AAC.31
MLPKESRPALLRFERASSEIIQKLETEVKEKHADIRKQLAEAGLPGTLEHYAQDQGQPKIPDALFKRMQDSAASAQKIQQLSAEIQYLSSSNMQRVNKVRSQIAAEEKKDMDFRARSVDIMAPWTGASSTAILAEYTKDCQHYEQLLGQAARSDAYLLEQIGSPKLQGHIQLVMKSRSEVEASLPRAEPLSEQESSSGFIEPRPRYNTNTLQGLLVQLAQFLTEREQTLATLKSSTSSQSLRAKLSEAAKNAGFGGPDTESLSLDQDIFERITDAELRQLETAERSLRQSVGQEGALLAQTMAENHRFKEAVDVDPVRLLVNPVHTQAKLAALLIFSCALGQRQEGRDLPEHRGRGDERADACGQHVGGEAIL